MEKLEEEEKQQGNGILVIDGAYFNINFGKLTGELVQDKDREFFMGVLRGIESLCNVQFRKSYYISSDDRKEDRAYLYTNLKDAGIEVLLKGFKYKMVKCLAYYCEHNDNQNKISSKVQAEVDVYIATKMIEECLRDRAEANGKSEGHIEHVVLFAGDIDFREAIKLITGDLIRKKVTIVGFRRTLSIELHTMNQVTVKYVDEIFNQDYARAPEYIYMEKNVP